MNDLDCDIVACTKTHLSSSISNHEIDIDDFCIERRDRGSRHGGGVLFYISNNINYVRLYEFEGQNSEMLWIEITNISEVIIFGVCYRPPGQNALDVNLRRTDHFFATSTTDRGIFIPQRYYL